MTTVYNQLYLLQVFSIDSKELSNNVNNFLIILSKDCIVIVVISSCVDLNKTGNFISPEISCRMSHVNVIIKMIFKSLKFFICKL